LPELPVIEGAWSAQSGFAAATRLDPTATAVFCGNDQMAMGVIHALGAEGKSVPADLSLIGFDDIPEAGHMVPPLTTIHQDFRGVGRLAVELLVAALESEDLPDTTPLPATLVVRGSVSAPRD
jgi:DNA-binding LacI/PurR family transcriptional regulator